MKLSLQNLTCALVAGTSVPVASFAAIDIRDSSTFYDSGNWYGYRSNSNVQFSSAENSITFSKIDSSSYVWTYFDPITLSLGEKLSFTGTFTFGKIASGGVFSLGFFNSGLCGKDQMTTHTYQSKTDVSSMKNYSVGKNAISTATGGMTGVSASNEKAYLRTNANSSTAFLSTSSGAQQKTQAFSPVFSAPGEGAAYEISFEILKTASGLELLASFDSGETQRVSFETDISTFDVFGLRSPVTASGNGITLGTVSLEKNLSTIPEPSAACGIFGLFSVALAARLRRRRHSSQ